MKSLRLLALVLTTLMVGSALADLKMETFTRASMLTGLGSTEANAVTQYQGDKRTEENTTKMVGGIGGVFAGKPQTSVQITRLDKDLVWDLNPPKKTYTERPIALPTGTETRAERRQSGPEQKPYKIVKSEIKVTKPGATKTINGFACTEYVITWEVVMEDTASKGKVTQVMTTDLWNTPLTDQLKKAQAIEAEFNRAYTKKLGVELAPEETDRLGTAMLTSMYGLDPKETAGKMDEVAKEMAKVEGYPIVTEVKWQLKDDSTAKKPEPEPESEPAPRSLRGLIGKEIAKNIVPAKPKDEGVVFSSYQEVKSVSLDAIPETAFEIPDGYKKVEK
ncbi:hypothetical protein JXD38_04435 [candidate division WOR-3 bacterium]|nr:hypothetical protein [candidate division WOR-3 bacterium]